MKEKTYKAKYGYNKESKKIFIEHYTWLLVYEIYLDQKYHKKDNNSYKIIWNTCYNSQWILNENETNDLIKNAIDIAKKEYGIEEELK